MAPTRAIGPLIECVQHKFGDIFVKPGNWQVAPKTHKRNYTLLPKWHIDLSWYSMNWIMGELGYAYLSQIGYLGRVLVYLSDDVVSVVNGTVGDVPTFSNGLLSKNSNVSRCSYRLFHYSSSDYSVFGMWSVTYDFKHFLIFYAIGTESTFKKVSQTCSDEAVETKIPRMNPYHMKKKNPMWWMGNKKNWSWTRWINKYVVLPTCCVHLKKNY